MSTEPQPTLNLDPLDDRGDPRAGRARDDAPAAGLRRPGRLRLGARHDLPRLDLRRPRLERRRAGSYLMREVGDDSVVVIGGERRPPARLPQRLPAPRRAADRATPRAASAGGFSCPYHALVVRLRRRAQGDSSHGRGRGLRHLLLGPDPGSGRDRRRASCWSTSAARRPTSSRTSASWPGTWSATASRARPRAGETDLRGRGQLEGDRRELQRVPALPGRPPRAQRPQQLHERRGDGGSGRLVRRLDDPARRRRDDGARGRPRARPAADRGPLRRRPRRRSSTSCCSPTRSSRSIPTT